MAVERQPDLGVRPLRRHARAARLHLPAHLGRHLHRRLHAGPRARRRPTPRRPRRSRSTQSGLVASFDGRSSSDPDGTDRLLGVGLRRQHQRHGRHTAAHLRPARHLRRDAHRHRRRRSHRYDDPGRPGHRPPADQVIASDNFERSATGRGATRTSAGPWTVSTGVGVSAVSGGKGRLVMLAAGRGPGRSLDGVTTNDLDLAFDLGFDKSRIDQRRRRQRPSSCGARREAPTAPWSASVATGRCGRTSQRSVTGGATPPSAASSRSRG